MTTDTQARLRSWISWLPLLVLGVAGIVGYRVWTDTLEQSPVADVHAAFLDFMAEQSPTARAYRGRYDEKFGRGTVASRHFEQVCAEMLRSAVADGVDPARYSEPMARACRSMGRKHPPGELPREDAMPGR